MLFFINFEAWNIYELSAFILWMIAILVLVISLVLAIIFYKKSKTRYAIGLIFLCIGFTIGRILKVIEQFFLGEPISSNFEFGSLIYVNFLIWSIILIIFVLSGYFLFNKKMQGKKFIIMYISFIIILILITYFIIFLIESNIGIIPNQGISTGFTLLAQNIAYVCFWSGFIILIYYVEKANKDLFNINKTKNLYTVITIMALLFTVIENSTGSVTFILIILFISSMAGMGSIFLYMAVISTGKIRRNSLLVCIGHFLLAFSFAIEYQNLQFLFAFLPEILLLLLPPILHIAGLIFYVSGLFPILFKK